MSDVADWLIRKGAYFYCPNKSGYTTVKSQAGRYTELDARREAEIEPWHMEAIHQDNVPDPVGDINVSEIAALKATLASKDKALAEIRAERDEAKRLLEVQTAGHKLSARDATQNLIRATKAEAERNGWQRIVGQIAGQVPLPHVLKATGTAADLIAYFKGQQTELAEIRAENERWCDAAQATSAKLTAANAELARVRKAIEAGKLLANAAFNISRMSIAQIDAYHLLSLKAAQEAWDEALSASRALSQDER